MKDQNFEIISVAQDTGGVKDAGKWIEAGKVELVMEHFPATTIVDDMHALNLHTIFGTSYAIANTKDYNWYVRSIANLCLIDSAQFMYANEQVTGVIDDTTV